MTENDKEFILDITMSMLERCDGAKAVDGAGFNKFDSIKARSQGSNPYVMAFVLLKYRGQIIGMGYDYERLVSIVQSIKASKEEREKRSGKKIPKLSVFGDYIVLDTPYNVDFKDFVKSLGGRYNPDNRTWSVSIGFANEVVAEFKRVFGTNVDEIDIPEHVYSGIIYCNGVKSDVLVKMGYYPKFIEYIKTVEVFQRARKWDAEKKVWRITVANKQIVDEIFHMAEKFNMEFSEDAEKNLTEIMDNFDVRKEMSNKASGEMQINGLNGNLFPFQSAGVQFVEEVNGRVLIADEMGLGKTIQALAWLQLHPDVRPTIIIVPNNVKVNWQRETEKWMTTNKKIVVVNGGKTMDTSGDITIINYDIVKKHLETLKAMNPKCIILDECHYAKNGKAQRTKAIQQLTKGVPHVIALSGTPILNRPKELWTIANMVSPATFNNWERYVTRYCDGHRGKYGWEIDGASNLDELQTKLRQTMMIRRVKADVLKELPLKRRETVFMGMNEADAKKYTILENSLVKWLKMNMKDNKEISASLNAEALVKIGEMRKLVAKAKLESIQEWIQNFMESSTGKLVLFCHHHSTIEAVKTMFPEILVVSGDMNIDERQKSIDAFQNNDSKRLIILTFGAGGVGITLTKAQDVAFIELAWRPADLSQAEDRIHRIGQIGSVTAWYLLAPDTIDEMMMEMINEKAKVSSEALDVDVDSSIQRNLLKMFLRE